MSVSSSTFAKAALSIFGGSQLEGEVFARRFRAHFGITTDVCVILWTHIAGLIPIGFRPEHLLWGMLFLKCYHTEHVNATLAAVDEKTFRKWCWVAVRALSKLDLIVWQDRLVHGSLHNSFISVDGTDFRIQEPTPFSPAWFSFRFHGPGVRYEVGICIRTGQIVWLHGPFPCGAFNDLQIFRDGLKTSLLPQERVIADRGYADDVCLNPNSESELHHRIHSVIRARHETLNKRLKQFRILHNTFRHDLSLHSCIVFAIANVTQVMLVHSGPLFEL